MIDFKLGRVVHCPCLGVTSNVGFFLLLQTYVTTNAMPQFYRDQKFRVPQELACRLDLGDVGLSTLRLIQ